MDASLPNSDTILSAIQEDAKKNNGKPPSLPDFIRRSGISEYHILKHFRWNEAVKRAGLVPYEKNFKIPPEVLLEDWGKIVRGKRQIPTKNQYEREGTYSAKVFYTNFGAWPKVPEKFRVFANGKSEWLDVVALLPIPIEDQEMDKSSASISSTVTARRHTKRNDRPTYGDPIDFRGLRHAPVNEDGVVFLFGMVARELGYLVEAVQAGFPDCEAKRQIDAGRWQRVRIEFEFESRNFHDHGHPPDGCDVIVCWRHNWPDCPRHLEIIELASELTSLASSDE